MHCVCQCLLNEYAAAAAAAAILDQSGQLRTREYTLHIHRCPQGCAIPCGVMQTYELWTHTVPCAIWMGLNSALTKINVSQHTSFRIIYSPTWQLGHAQYKVRHFRSNSSRTSALVSPLTQMCDGKDQTQVHWMNNWALNYGYMWNKIILKLFQCFISHTDGGYIRKYFSVSFHM